MPDGDGSCEELAPSAMEEIVQAVRDVRTGMATVRECVERFGVCVMPFYQAPKELRDLSEHGGDEDYIIVTPQQGEDWDVGRIIDRLTVSDDQEVGYSGLRVYITAHA